MGMYLKPLKYIIVLYIQNDILKCNFVGNNQFNQPTVLSMSNDLLIL